MSKRPSVGRVVHYVSYGTPNGEFPSTCRAAIVTAVPNGMWRDPLDREPTTPCVDLAVMNPEGMFFNRGVPEDHEEKRGGTWHWPEFA